MALTEEYTGSNGTWGTEFSLTAHSTTLAEQSSDGLYAPWVDTSALARGDLYRLRAYESVESAGTKRIVLNQDIPGWGLAFSELFTLPPLMLLHKWDFTLTRIAGSDRTIEYGVRGVEGAVTEAFAGSDTITTTEFFLASDSTTKTKQTTAGLYQLFLDVNALAKSDEFELKMYEEVRDAATTDRSQVLGLLKGVRTAKVYVTPTLFLDNGWEFSLDKIAGTDQAIPRSIRKVA
jgi:hypothetical protein